MSRESTFSVEVTVSVGASLGLDFKEIGSVGLEFGASITTAKGNADGVQITCNGPWTCGLLMIPSVLEVSGEETSYTGGCEATTTTNPYTVQFPRKVGETARASFKPCACKNKLSWEDEGAPEPCPEDCWSNFNIDQLWAPIPPFLAFVCAVVWPSLSNARTTIRGWEWAHLSLVQRDTCTKSNAYIFIGSSTGRTPSLRSTKIPFTEHQKQSIMFVMFRFVWLWEFCHSFYDLMIEATWICVRTYWWNWALSHQRTWQNKSLKNDGRANWKEEFIQYPEMKPSQCITPAERALFQPRYQVLPPLDFPLWYF